MATGPDWEQIAGSDEAWPIQRPPGPRGATGETVPPALGDHPMPAQVALLGGIVAVPLPARAPLEIVAGMRFHRLASHR